MRIQRLLILLHISAVVSFSQKSQSKLTLSQKSHFQHELARLSSVHSITKRDACPGGEGNFGFNSFNFMTFVLLVYNAVANVNNNLNNNNNNINDNNVNSVTQDSNQVSSNTQSVNQLMVTVLPIPGKRSLRLLDRFLKGHFRCASNSTVPSAADVLVNELYRRMIALVQDEAEADCKAYRICTATKEVIAGFGLQEAYSVHLGRRRGNPWVSQTQCPELFPTCGTR